MALIVKRRVRASLRSRSSRCPAIIPGSRRGGVSPMPSSVGLNLTRLAVSDLDMALSLLPTGDCHDAVLRDWITQRLAAPGPDLAARASMAMRNQLARALLMAWRERDAAAAASWLARVLDSRLAEEVVKRSMTNEPGFVARGLFEWRGDPSRGMHLSSLLDRRAILDSSDAFRCIQSIRPSEPTSRDDARCGGVYGSIAESSVEGVVLEAKA